MDSLRAQQQPYQLKKPLSRCKKFLKSLVFRKRNSIQRRNAVRTKGDTPILLC